MLAGMTAALLAVILVISIPAQALSAKSAVLMDAATGRLIVEKCPDQKSLIASTTKIMTALLICEQCNVLDRMRIPKEAAGIEGSSMYLQEGEILTVQELLYGLMLRSGNDAAVALAIYCAGTVEGFVQMMNDKARSLNMTGSHFENPNGLDSQNHYSTARDLAVLAAAAMENPIFSKIVSTKTMKVGTRYLKNHNKLLWQLEGADGVKTGYTKAAGRILVSSVYRNGRRLIGVTIADPADWNDHMTLMEYGFSQYKERELIRAGDVLGHAEVAGGESERIEIVALDDFSYLLSDGEEVSVKLPSPGFVYAPVASGQNAGDAHIFLQGKQIGSVRVVYGETVEQKTDPKPGFIERLLGGKADD